jgi:DnaK suppressor protein
MHALELEDIRQKLLNLRSELQELEGSPREGTQPVDLEQAITGSLSRRDAMRAHIAAAASARQRTRLILKIDGALRRIQSGEYGKCFICEEELDLSSLSADPTITRCMNCIEE